MHLRNELKYIPICQQNIKQVEVNPLIIVFQCLWNSLFDQTNSRMSGINEAF